MKLKSYLSLYFLLLFSMIVALLPACKKSTENSSAPVILSIKSYVASPNDTVLHSAVPNGQYVVITGSNLQNATQISFNGVPATFNNALFAPNSAVVQIPNIQFSTIDIAKLFTLEYTTTGGSTTFSFKLGPAAPTITAISNVFAIPGDSVYVFGANLVLIERFSYAGTPISSFKPSADGTSIGFLMPAATPSDEISVTTKIGTVNFKIVATPTITQISNENASTGDSVYVYGTYLLDIEAFSFAGTAITSFKSSADGTSIGFVLPALTHGGPVSITTKFGTTATLYNVHDVATGRISDWEWDGSFNWQYWGGSYNVTGSPDFPGNSTQYMVLKRPVLSPGEGNTYSDYAIRMNDAQWVPLVNLADPVDHWAFKFELSVPQAWNGGSIVITGGLTDSPMARFEPWQISATKTAPYSTKKWVTVTIPLSWFRGKDATLGEGKGASIAKIADLTGSKGSTSCYVYLHNYATAATTTGFYGAFDNFRVVRIK